ncbi:MAG: hypothetical protein LBN22_09205, partial [Clostridiales Family XIII bacterium]|nr:hypothetical protein [Clostridiales Family XIII bacterium]
KKKPKLASEVHHHDAESATVATDIATDTVAIASQPNGNDIALVVDSSSNLDHSNNHGDNQSKKKNRSELLREIWANKNQNTEQVEVAAEPAVHNEAPSIDEPAIATIDASVSVEDVVATTPTAITLPKTRKKSTKKAKDNVAADSTVAVSNVATDSTVVSIATAPDPGQKVEYTSPPESIRKRIRPVIQAEGLNRGAFRTVYDLFAKSEKKLELNNSLIRAYKQEAGSRLYKSLVPIFNDYVKMR